MAVWPGARRMWSGRVGAAIAVLVSIAGGLALVSAAFWLLVDRWLDDIGALDDG